MDTVPGICSQPSGNRSKLQWCKFWLCPSKLGFCTGAAILGVGHWWLKSTVQLSPIYRRQSWETKSDEVIYPSKPVGESGLEPKFPHFHSHALAIKPSCMSIPKVEFGPHIFKYVNKKDCLRSSVVKVLFTWAQYYPQKWGSTLHNHSLFMPHLFIFAVLSPLHFLFWSGEVMIPLLELDLSDNF